MKLRHILAAGVAAVVCSIPIAGVAQYVSPNVITTAGDVQTILGKTVFINHGLVGVGRLAADTMDTFGETFGSASALQITGWGRDADGSYHGTLQILPDRGYNSGNFYADYAARMQHVGFRFVPYEGAAPIGGVELAGKMAAQNQITFTSITGDQFMYMDPTRGLTRTTGLDPASSSLALFGDIMPYVTNYTGQQSPSSVVNTTYNGINRLPLDSEALVVKGDGSGYIGDEYGAHVYYFNASKQIIGAIVPPAALRPHKPIGTLNFSSAAAPTNGRRNNQGFEGVALSPDGTRLFVLLQSAAVQDSASGSAANRRQTRLLVYDVSVQATPTTPSAEYALTLPTYRQDGNSTMSPDATCAQSEIIALDTHRILILSRDGNGLGNASSNPSMFKSFLLADLLVGSPTDFASNAARNAEGGKITTSAGVLDSALTPVTWVEAVNMLNSTQLNKFNINLDSGVGQVSQLTLGEKWEGATLVPALDPSAPNDYFLFVGNDNDFLTSAGHMRGPDGTVISYDGFNGYPANRQPANSPDGGQNANDTMFLVFRVTIMYDVEPPTFAGLPSACSLWPPDHKLTTVGTITASDALSGVAPGTFTVTATSSDPDGASDIVITPDGHGGFVVQLRAERSGNGPGRTYTITASATDVVGNMATTHAYCFVPHDQRN
jgi:hypothetical protein